MSFTASILKKLDEAPRAVRWLIFGGGSVVLFLIWDSAIRPQVDDLNNTANAIEQHVKTIQEGESQTGRLNKDKSTIETIVAVGPVTHPGPENRGREALTAAARDVLKKFQVHDDSYELRGGGGRLDKDLSQNILRQSTRRLNRLSCDLEFIASPEVTMDVIGYLESYEDIESISNVRITKDSSRQVKVRLTLEAWVEGPEGRR